MNRYRHRIIIEGMDGSGKTTLIGQLTERIPELFVVPGLGSSDDFPDRLAELVDEQQDEDGRTPIHDRLFFSELVYGAVVRGKVNLPAESLQNFGWFFRSTAFLVYCRPPADELREGVKAKPQMPGVISRYQQLLEAYDQLMVQERNWFGPRFFHYSWTRPEELVQLTDRLRGYLRE